MVPKHQAQLADADVMVVAFERSTSTNSTGQDDAHPEWLAEQW
jgi:hypothetical protein